MELKEKDAELLKYKQGLTKLEELLQEKGNLNSTLLQQNLLKAFAFAKAEKAVLKEALDAERLSHQVAEAVLKDTATERNRLKLCLSNLSREASFKMQQLNSELETCRIRELANLEEVKRLSASLNFEHIYFQREQHEMRVFVETLAIQRPSPPQKPAISADAAYKRMAEMHKDTLVSLQADECLLSESLKVLIVERIEASKQLMHQFEKVKEEMESLRVEAMRSDELEKELNLLHKRCAEAESLTKDLKRELDSLKSEKSAYLEESKSLSLVLSEKARKVDSLEDALRVKNKMLDSQNDTIRELKSNVADLRKQLIEKTAAIEGVELNLRRQLQEEADQVHALRAEVAEQDVVISELEEESQGHQQAKTVAEAAKDVLEKRLAEKDGMLRYIEGEIERVQDLYEKREKMLTLEKDKAVDNVEHLTREKTALKAELEDLLKQKTTLEEKENNLREAFDSQAQQMSQLSSQLSSMMATLDAQTHAREKMKTLYSSKVNELCKALEALRDVDVQ